MLRHFHPEWHIVEAADGQSAHVLYLHHGADIIITDNEMPVMSGTQLIAILRAEGVRTPIVMVSSDQPAPRVLTFDDLTVFLSKPACIHQFLTTITQLLAVYS